MKIRGNTVGTTLKPEKAVVKCQNLTEEEKAQARANIDAVWQGDYDQRLDEIEFDINQSVSAGWEQTFTESQKARARANIGAAAVGEAGGGASMEELKAYIEETILGGEW